MKSDSFPEIDDAFRLMRRRVSRTLTLKPGRRLSALHLPLRTHVFLYVQFCSVVTSVFIQNNFLTSNEEHGL